MKKKRKKSRLLHHAVVVSALRNKINWDRFSQFVDTSWFPVQWGKVLVAMEEFFERHDDKKEVTIRQMEAILSETGDDKIDLRPLQRISKVGSDVAEQSLIRFVKEHLAQDAIIEHQNSQDKDTGVAELIDELERIERVTSMRTDVLDYLHFDPLRRLALIGQRQTPISTPIPGLSLQMEGGLRTSELCTLIAPTDGGKTMFCCCWGARALREGKSVLHITTETDVDEVASRYDCSLMLAGINWIRDHQTRLTRRYKTLSSRGGRMFVYDYTTKFPSIANINRAIEEFARSTGAFPEFLIVDRGDLCRSRRNLGAEPMELKAVWRELRQTSRRYSLPVLATSQFNRGGSRSDNADMEDVGEAWAKVTDSDVVIILTGDMEARSAGFCRVKLAKKKTQGSYFDGFVRMDTTRCDFRPLSRRSRSRNGT